MTILDHAIDFVKLWQLPETQIRRPSKFVFLCGGKISNGAADPTSAREAFLRHLPHRDQIGDAKIILAESANQMLVQSSFDNLLDLEEYISAMVESVVLFVESAGAICELGAFTQIREIREKLLVFVMNDHGIVPSFITLGPLKFLQGDPERSQVELYPWTIVSDIAHVPDYSLSVMVEQCIAAASRNGVRQRLNLANLGHFILTVLAVTFLLRGGLLGEIKECVSVLKPDCKQTEVIKALDILQILGLVKPVSNGPKRKHYVPQISRINVDIKLTSASASRDPLRILSDITAVIREEDKTRTRIFSENNHAD